MAHSADFAKGLSIGIIMDGNGRWAKKRGLPRTTGHKKGAEVFQDITRYCNELGVSSVYFYAFSTENWKRPEEEVSAIMRLFGEYLLKAYDYEKENNRVVFLGDRSALSQKYQEEMNEIETKTAHNTGNCNRCIIVTNHKCIFIDISFNTVKSLECERSIKALNSNLFNLTGVKCVHRLSHFKHKVVGKVGKEINSSHSAVEKTDTHINRRYACIDIFNLKA